MAGGPIIPPRVGSTFARTSFRPSPLAEYASIISEENGEQGQAQQKQHEVFHAIDLSNLRPPQPAYLARGNGQWEGETVEEEGRGRVRAEHHHHHGVREFRESPSETSDAEFWRAPIEPRDRNPCRRRATLTPTSRRKLNGIFWGLFLANLPLPVTAAVTYSRHFSDALSWMTRGEICHLRG